MNFSAKNMLSMSRVIAAVILLAALAYPFLHDAPPSLPEVVPDSAKDGEISAKVAAADAIRDLVNLLVTLTLGLAAIVGFVIKDGPGQGRARQLIIPIVFAAFVYFFFRVVTYAFYTYSSLALQLEQGVLLPGYTENFIVPQVRALMFGAILAAVMGISKLLDKVKERGGR